MPIQLDFTLRRLAELAEADESLRADEARAADFFASAVHPTSSARTRPVPMSR